MAKINITTDEEITTVTFSIDGYAVYNGIFTEPPYEFKIQNNFLYKGRIKGRHKIGVHVITINGNSAYDEIDFYALTPI